MEMVAWRFMTVVEIKLVAKVDVAPFNNPYLSVR